MKEKLYTIPVNDAFDRNCECPICAMRQVLETQSVEYTMGASYMEDDVRAETDKAGFCRKHMEDIYAQKNMLGMALVLKTHLVKTTKDLEKLSGTPMKPASFFKKAEKSELNRYIDTLEENCFICNRINQVFDRYVTTVFHLYHTDEAFREKYAKSKGFCTKHYGLLMERAPKELKGDELNAFAAETSRLYLDNMHRMIDDLEWFINKFDYRYKDEPWKNSKDAVPRAMIKTHGILPDEDAPTE